MAAAGISSTVPIHIAESGSPTSPERSQADQATSLDTIVDTVLERREDLGITTFELFGLRDADSSLPDPFHQFGIMTDTYVPKRAYSTFRDIVARTP